MTGFTCSAPLYEYEHGGKTWLIEVPKIGGPWLIKPGGDPYVRFPGGGWAALDAFIAESDRERFRVGGGYERF